MQAGHRGRGWRWRGSARQTVRFVEPALLLLLHYGPAHGYTLIERLGEFDLANMDPSAIYRVLREMEERGWLRSARQAEGAQGPPRRVYHLTELGNQVLAGLTRDLLDTRQVIDHILAEYEQHMERGQGDYHQERAKSGAVGRAGTGGA